METDSLKNLIKDITQYQCFATISNILRKNKRAENPADLEMDDCLYPPSIMTNLRARIEQLEAQRMNVGKKKIPQ